MAKLGDAPSSASVEGIDLSGMMGPVKKQKSGAAFFGYAGNR